MHVSVIIPVYNAAKFLEEAVRSALEQPQTQEVILIEDGSKDQSLKVCETLAEHHSQIRLLTHPGNQNLGAGASRNLGIQHANSEYIAFLDADDIYLPSRFQITEEVFNAHLDAEGVYETIGSMYDDASLQTKHLHRTGGELTGLQTSVSPSDLFRTLATGKHGHLHLNGLVVKRSALPKDFLFDTALRQCQDSDWILHLAMHCKLYPGQPDRIVALRRVHHANRVLHTPDAIRYQRQYLRKWINADFYGSQDSYAGLYLIARYVSWSNNGTMRRLGPLSKPCIVGATALYLLTHPGIALRLLKK